MRVEKPLRRRFGRKLACVQHVAGVKGGGGGFREGKKEKKEVGKKGKGLEREQRERLLEEPRFVHLCIRWRPQILIG